VYSDTSLVIQDAPHAAGYRLPSGAPVRVPTSSSTMPGLMARMLDALDIADGARVLEIGTGTGYNAALLSHALGERNVVSIDIDPALVAAATERLDRLGHHPTLLSGDGAAGAAESGPYDRILATAAVADIPIAWIRQLAPGGKILANLRGELAGGTLCLLGKRGADDEVIGPVLPLGGHFMWLRPKSADPHRPHERPAPARRGPVTRTTSGVDPAIVPVDDDGFRFLLQLQLPGARSLDRRPDAVLVTATDGSRAEATNAGRVIQSGPRRLWDTVESTCRLWAELDRPAPARFGVVANDTTQFAWFGADDGWHRWPLPLV
jgi:protein-L-isoaspartate O-methyltransferase